MQKGDRYRHTVDEYFIVIVSNNRGVVWFERSDSILVKKIPVDRFSMLASSGIFEKVN